MRRRAPASTSCSTCQRADRIHRAQVGTSTELGVWVVPTLTLRSTRSVAQRSRPSSSMRSEAIRPSVRVTSTNMARPLSTSPPRLLHTPSAPAPSPLRGATGQDLSAQPLRFAGVTQTPEQLGCSSLISERPLAGGHSDRAAALFDQTQPSQTTGSREITHDGPRRRSGIGNLQQTISRPRDLQVLDARGQGHAKTSGALRGISHRLEANCVQRTLGYASGSPPGRVRKPEERLVCRPT